MKQMILAVAVAAMAGGAWAAEPPPDPSQLKAGVATEADVVGLLGKPQSVSVDSTGTRTIVYISVKTRIKAASFIPYVGIFAGGVTSDAAISSFTFGADGRLISYRSTSSQTDCASNPFDAHCSGGVPVPTPPNPAPAPPADATNAATP